MKFSQLLEARRKNWQQLEQLCSQLEDSTSRSVGAASLSRFAALYRSVCADLALADSYQLPPNTTQYLHRLVGRAHNQLYRTRKFQFRLWGQRLLYDVPRAVFQDRCVQVAFMLFWGVFLLSALLAANPKIAPGFTEKLCSPENVTQVEDSFSEPINGRDPRDSIAMVAFYIWHNTSIALQCFAGGLLVIPGLFTTIFNASQLGALFGYMSQSENGDNFFHFVTAHGPFELTSIVLSAGAGLRLGVAWLAPSNAADLDRAASSLIGLGLNTSLTSSDGNFASTAVSHSPGSELTVRGSGTLSRTASLRRAGIEVMPVIGAAMILMSLAALIEGLLSPSGLPYWVKATVAILCTVLLLFYFVVLGYPRKASHAA